MTPSYWVSDSEGRVLGPLSLQTLAELVAAQRIREVSRVSRDGETWVPLHAVSEVAGLFLAPEPSKREQDEATKAKQLRNQLVALRNRPPHEVLGVRAEATLEEHRTAFFALAKRFHPARLPPGTHPELREACYETFQFLSDLMQAVEARLAPRAPAPAAGPTSAAPTPAARYEAQDFVGLTKSGEGIEATIRVNPKTASIFTEHHTVNFSNESVFLPTPHHLPLGTMLNINLIFDNAMQIRSRARVIWENVNETAKAKLGFGVRLLSLEKKDRQFIRDYLSSGGREPSPEST